MCFSVHIFVIVSKKAYFRHFIFNSFRYTTGKLKRKNSTIFLKNYLKYLFQKNKKIVQWKMFGYVFDDRKVSNISIYLKKKVTYV